MYSNYKIFVNYVYNHMFLVLRYYMISRKIQFYTYNNISAKNSRKDIKVFLIKIFLRVPGIHIILIMGMMLICSWLQYKKNVMTET